MTREIRRMHLLWAITASYPFGLHRTHSVLHLITLAKTTKIDTEQSLLYPLAVSATVYREMFSFCFMIFFIKTEKRLKSLSFPGVGRSLSGG